jgi:hypothetical protein
MTSTNNWRMPIFIFQLSSSIFIFVKNKMVPVFLSMIRARRDHDRMVVGFTTTCVISAYHY